MEDNTPHPVDAELTAIALAYRNPDQVLIADSVLPSTPTAAKFSWLEHELSQGYTVPDTRIGRKSNATEVEFNSVEREGKVADHGLSDFIPATDESDDTLGVMPARTATMFLTGLVKLAREIRVASMVTDPALYATPNKLALSGTDVFDNAASDPVRVVGDMLDVPVMRPNVITFPQRAWTVFRRHAKVVAAIKGDAGGTVTREDVAAYFEVAEVLVGGGFVNTAKLGQPVALQRCWGNAVAAFYRDRMAGPQTGVTFGFTARKEDLQVKRIPEPKRGVMGGESIMVFERCREVVAAPSLGILITGVLAGA